MKKILTTILALFVIAQSYCFAQEQSLDFIYMNGANANSQKNKETFYNEVFTFHKALKKTFENNDLMVQLFLNNNELKIEKEPNIFYWSNNSNKIKNLNQILEQEKKTTPPFAYVAKKSFT